MTMLCGWASQKETYPLSNIGEAFQNGVAQLDKIDRRFIVQGEGGTVFGLGFALRSSSNSNNQPQIHPRFLQLKPEYGSKIKLSKSRETSRYSWYELRGRLSSPESVAFAISLLGLNELLVDGAFGIITARPDKLKSTQHDNTAPLEILPSLAGGTVGLITNMIEELPQLRLDKSRQDGRTLLRKIAKDMNHSSADVTGSAMAQRLYLLKKFGNLEYSLHWALLDLDLQFVHALHSREYANVPRAYPYLFIGKHEKSGTVAFGSKAEMFRQNLGIIKLEAPDINQVRTHFTQIST